MRVLTILLRYGTDQYTACEQQIAEIFRRRMPGIERAVIVVDNALPAKLIEQTPQRALIGGDNSAWEFTGFDCGLRFVGSRIWQYDLVHFATSAFNTLYTDYLDRFDEALLALVARHPVSIGHIDCYNEPVELLGFRLQHWIRSCFFFVPPAEALMLGSFASLTDGRPFFSGDPAQPFRHDAPISENYRRYILDWLTGEDIGQGVRWHSRLSLTKETLQSFEGKALAILNEQLLSARLRAMGCAVVDVTWLSSSYGRNGSVSIFPALNWREQLALRKTL